jgi:hypothetical protein
MIKDIKKLLEKYKDIGKRHEYIFVGHVVDDLYQLLREARIKRIPKRLR